MPGAPPVSVIETPEFLAATRKLMDDAERLLLVDYLAWNPTAGDLIPGTGGVRKLRWALRGRGKRGGARVIYFFHGPDLPLFLLTGYSKSERTDLSQAHKGNLRRLTKLLTESYGKRTRS